MSRYRVETAHGRHLLCGGGIPADMVKPGQVWAGSGNTTVTVRSNDGEWVTYFWQENGETRIHTKSNFGFQCRYCLVLEDGQVPEELT